MPMLNDVVAMTIRNFDPYFVKVDSTASFISTVDARVYIVI